jgi:hypothetical protein
VHSDEAEEECEVTPSETLNTLNGHVFSSEDLIAVADAILSLKKFQVFPV